jgi:hypothetical protein
MRSDLSITSGDKRIIQSLLLALEPVSNLGGLVPLRLVTAFLTVATDEGKGVSEYARCLGIHRATVFRFIHVGRLSDIRRRQDERKRPLVSVSTRSPSRVSVAFVPRSLGVEELVRRSVRLARAGP